MQSIGNKFIQDLDSVIKKFEDELTEKEYQKILRLREDLIEKHNRREVKINHSVMELICAKHLIKNGFDVDIEHELPA